MEALVTPNDPTDHALAAIASVRDQPQSYGASQDTAASASVKAEGYTKTGPGPLAAIRIKWTARAIGNITYVVDETIGESIAARTSAPMSLEAAMQYIDEREHAAHRRFEQLRNDLAWPRPVAPDEVTE